MHKRKIFVICILVLAYSLTVLALSEENAKLEVHFLDVGRNDGILIRMGNECAFIDGGLPEFTYIASEYMKNIGVSNLKYYIATHGHTDHVGGAALLMSKIPAETILYNSALTERTMLDFANSPAKQKALSDAKMVLYLAGDTVKVGDALLTCILPLTVSPKTDRMDVYENGNSMVIRVTYGEHSFLLTGDMFSEAIASFSETHPELIKCTVVKNPHHNSYLNADFLTAASPEYFVYSTAHDYMPERTDVKQVLSTGARVFITNRKNSGNTVFVSDGKEITVITSNVLESLSVSHESVKVHAGGRAEITSSFPSRFSDTIHWASSDESVAEIELGTGTVKILGKTPGSCCLTATAFDGTQKKVYVEVN